MNLKTRNLLVMFFVYITLFAIVTENGHARLEGLVGAWLFDDGKGDVAKDFSGNGNDGKLMGKPKWVAGKFGQALELNGADDWVNMGDNPILKPETNGNGDVTFLVWYKWDGGNYVLSTGGQTSSTGIAITHDPGAATIWFGVSTGQKSASTDYADYEKPGKGWHHLAGSYDDTRGEFIAYVDGKVLKKVQASAKAVDNKWQELHVGKPNNTGAYFLKGVVDEVAFFSVPLSEGQSNTIMNLGIERATAVSSQGKLTTIWADIKAKK